MVSVGPPLSRRVPSKGQLPTIVSDGKLAFGAKIKLLFPLTVPPSVVEMLMSFGTPVSSTLLETILLSSVMVVANTAIPGEAPIVVAALLKATVELDIEKDKEVDIRPPVLPPFASLFEMVLSIITVEAVLPSATKPPNA